MGRPYSLHTAPLLAMLLPCALIGVIGYKWIELEREAGARRGEKAAESEAARIRKALVSHLAAVTSEVARGWSGLPAGRLPFAPAPPLPELVASAFVFTPAGKLAFPDYQRAYLLASGNSESTVLLNQGKLSLAAGHYREAEASGQKLLLCCAARRDEYGVSFALYAAVQIAAALEGQGRLRAGFPGLAAQLGDLLQRGAIGHPNDLQDIAALAARAGGVPEASRLLQQAEEQAVRVRNQIELGSRLEKWVSGTVLAGNPGSGFTIHSLPMGDRPYLAGVHRTGDSMLIALFAAGPLAAWIASEGIQGGHFDAVLAPKGEYSGNAILRDVMLPEAPGLELSLRPREPGPAIEHRRQNLFTGALAAAVLLVLLLGWFAFRDVSREVRLASLRSDFVSSVTHELRTPLTSIRLLAETLRLKRTRDPATGDQMLGAIVDESERLTRLVDNVLSFSRIERDERPYHQKPVTLAVAVNEAVHRFESVLKRGEFRLVQESDDQTLRVLADDEALSRALLNLLDNAVKYSGPSREIELRVHRRGAEAEIRVTDHGIGVPAAEQRHIFEKFYRAPGVAGETTGAGLGLALVKHFAEAHGGRVAVASEPGAGSSFSLWLPLMENDGQNPDR